MAGEDFIPYQPETQAAPDFIPYQGQKVSQETVESSQPPTPTIGPGSSPSKENDFSGTGVHRDNAFGRFFQEAENMTQEGAQAHPIQNFVGQTVKRSREFGNILATMGTLFMGPEGITPAMGKSAEVPLPQPITQKQLPAARSIQAPASSLEEPISALESLGGRIPVEPAAKAPPTPLDVTAAPHTATAATVEPRPEVVAGPAKPPSTKSLLDRLGKQIEYSAKHPAIEPTTRANPARGTVGAKTVTEAPSDIVAGPRIDTASKNRTQEAVIGEQVEKAAGGKTVTPVSERNAGKFYEKLPDKQRQDIHVNLEVDRVPVPNAEKHWKLLSEKPGVRDDLVAMQNDQVREALRKSDILDMRNKTVKSSNMVSRERGGQKFKDPDIIPRAEAIGKMLDAGISPEDIVKWGGGTEARTKPAPERFKFHE